MRNRRWVNHALMIDRWRQALLSGACEVALHDTRALTIVVMSTMAVVSCMWYQGVPNQVEIY